VVGHWKSCDPELLPARQAIGEPQSRVVFSENRVLLMLRAVELPIAAAK
jgi:hypothetical protein